MTNEQLRVLLELVKGKIELEVDAIEAELAEHGAERYVQWYNRKTGARVLYFTPGELDGKEYESKPTGDLKALTGLRNLVSELGRYSKSLERSRSE